MKAAVWLANVVLGDNSSYRLSIKDPSQSPKIRSRIGLPFFTATSADSAKITCIYLMNRLYSRYSVYSRLKRNRKKPFLVCSVARVLQQPGFSSERTKPPSCNTLLRLLLQRTYLPNL